MSLTSIKLLKVVAVTLVIFEDAPVNPVVVYEDAVEDLVAVVARVVVTIVFSEY